MKLDKLAGYGPLAAFSLGGVATVFALMVLFGYSLTKSSPTAGAIVSVVEFVCFWLIPLLLLIVALDLEWIEHPATTDFWIAASHIAAIGAVVLPLVVGVAAVFQQWVLAGLSAVALSILVGFVLLVHNAEARRAGLYRGPLLWIGYAAGVGFVTVGLLPLLPPLGAVGVIVGMLSLIVWSIWLGTRLRGAKPLPTPPTPTAEASA